MPPCGSRWASPIRSACSTALRCATLVGEVVRAAHGQESRRLRTSPRGRQSTLTQPIAKSSGEIAESELLGLHEGNFARYQIRPSEFKAWGKIWNQ